MRNALEIAAFFGHEQVAKSLLKRGSEVNLSITYDRWMRKRVYERTALYVASRQFHTHVVKLLLD
jgi:ankyrin repeat protein